MIYQARYLKTEVDPAKLGESDAEVCFLGRSNAGKSSLINAVCNQKKMARVSPLPGKTRTINVYEVKFGRWIVDLPGYGYATGSRSEKEALGPIIESYLKNREKLVRIFLVIEAVAGVTRLDQLMLSWLKHHGFSFHVVVNKIDKIKSSQLDLRKKVISKGMGVQESDISWISTKKSVGIKEFQEIVFNLVEDS